MAKLRVLATAHFLSTACILGDRANLMLVDEQIWLALARQADHAIVKVLDPAGDSLTIMQLHGDANLLFAEKAQIESLLTGFARRRRFLTPSGGVKRRHIDIVADERTPFLVASEEESA